MKKLSFYERAEKLGHSAEGLKAGHKIASVISIPNIEELRKLLDDGSSDEDRAKREETLFGHIPLTSPETDTSDAGLLRRVHSYVYGNGALADSDREIIGQAFPLDVFAESAANVTYDVPTNLGTSQLMITLNYGTVTINDQACVSVYNSTLNYTMDTLVRNGTPPAGMGDFNILGVTGGTGPAGAAGATGGNGSTGKAGNCSSAGIAGDSGQNGTVGNTGGTGGVGVAGFDGLPSMPATITINQSIQNTNSIIVFTASGGGGTGGVGGQGGTGGIGGNGGNGATCGCTGSGAGNGVNGGVGGNGGTGGQGGNGVNASGNVIVNVPATYLNDINGISGPASPGVGGAGGTGGVGGAGGGGGSGGKHNGNGSGGSTGGNGTNGAKGVQGTQTGTPATIIPKPI